MLEPPGAFPQAATRLDALSPAAPHEAAIAVQRLQLDSTSHRQLREQANDDPDTIADAIAEIVAVRGKMHNPRTNSGGMLLGSVVTVGERYPDRTLRVGEHIATLASLTATPLRLDSVKVIDPDSSAIVVEGMAIVTPLMAWTRLPQDISSSVAVAVLDVYSAASHTLSLAHPGDHVLVLGAGRAGALACAAARRGVGDAGAVTVVDVSEELVRRAVACGIADHGVVANLANTVEAVDTVRSEVTRTADLTIVCVNSTGCETSAALLTRADGIVLFFAMATSFTQAALGAEAVSSESQLMIGNGFAVDRGAVAFELLRDVPALGQWFPADDRHDA